MGRCSGRAIINMKEIGWINKYKVGLLERTTTLKYISELVEIIDQIPLVNYTEKEVLAETKEDRKFNKKWEHSLIVFDREKPIAVIIGYERESEGNEPYPENTIYISELAVKKDYQKRGIGKKLIRIFLDYNIQRGFLILNGRINFSVQTNSAERNKHVKELYKSFGFKERVYLFLDLTFVLLWV